jgi:hypothetical protein
VRGRLIYTGMKLGMPEPPRNMWWAVTVVTQILLESLEEVDEEGSPGTRVYTRDLPGPENHRGNSRSRVVGEVVSKNVYFGKVQRDKSLPIFEGAKSLLLR